MLPVVALVGRPNVGKSTLFNRLTRTRDAIVADFPGLTRDRQYGQGKVGPCAYIVVDTGGFEPVRSEGIVREMAGQAEAAIAEADVVIFVCDARSGLTPHDERIARHLRSAGRPIFLAVNKSEGLDDSHVAEFHELGLGDPWRISAAHGQGVSGLLQTVLEPFVNAQDEEETEETDPDAPKRIKVTVAGRPNVGKSTLINALLGEERLIAYDMPGTTRDAIDTLFERNGKKYTIIDTAGIRKKRSVDDDVEYYSNMRAFDAVRRSDVCALVVDANEGLTEQDVKIIGYVHEQGKPSVIVMNKWDLVEKDTHTVNKFEEKLQNDLKFMSYYKSLYISAKTGQRAEKLLALCDEVYAHATFRVPTGALNDLIGDAVRISEPPSYLGRRMKIYYSSQVGVCPPTFALFVNDEGLMHFSYERYLENVIRGAYDFSGTPIKIVVRERKDGE